MKPKTPDMDRFLAKVLTDGECLVWTGGVDKDGYGKFTTWITKGGVTSRVSHRAHRWAYEQHHGTLDPGLLRHTCDNPRCVLVSHLEPGTQRDNVYDAFARGRRVTTLTKEIIDELRRVRHAGGSLRAAARRLGVSYSVAYPAAVGRSWRSA